MNSGQQQAPNYNASNRNNISQLLNHNVPRKLGEANNNGNADPNPMSDPVLTQAQLNSSKLQGGHPKPIQISQFNTSHNNNNNANNNGNSTSSSNSGNRKISYLLQQQQQQQQQQQMNMMNSNAHNYVNNNGSVQQQQQQAMSLPSNMYYMQHIKQEPRDV